MHTWQDGRRKGRRTLEWVAHAQCRFEDPDLFFPEGPTDAGYERQVAKAKGVCDLCAVQPQCLMAALAGGETGIWGGLTEQERKRLGWEPTTVKRMAARSSV